MTQPVTYAIQPGGVGLEAMRGALAVEHRVIGPVVRDGAIVYDGLAGVGELPWGWTAVQEAATWRLERRSDGLAFGWAVGPQSLRRFLQPARERLWTAVRTPEGFEVEDEPEDGRPLAFFGVRACDVAALGVHDQVFVAGEHVDLRYQARRRGAFVVAVDCAEPGGTCFCASMGTGPGAGVGADVILTEQLDAGGEPFYVARGGSARGEGWLAGLGFEQATLAQVAEARASVEGAAQRMGRSMPAPQEVRELLVVEREARFWDEVGARCLGCANCTLVCPTCFCMTVEDVTDLAGQRSERHRRWDSCFALDFSYLHGGAVRRSAGARYRQWMSHKLSTWWEQFGTSGCVGCGRCITWCPVGIDITAGVASMAAHAVRTGGGGDGDVAGHPG